MKTLITFLGFVGFIIAGHTQVGVGTTNPQAILHIEDTGTSDIFLVYDQASDATPFVIDQNGNVAIKALVDTNYSLTVGGRFKSAGIEELSDARYKKDVLTIMDALEKVMALRGVTYAWDQEKFPNLELKKGRQLGLIAQELETVVPEAVNTDTKGYKSVEYSHLVGLLIEAIKDQQSIIKSQEQKLTDLSKEVADQRNEIQNIYKLIQANNQ